MTLYSLIFYLLAGIILITTILAITRRNLVHTIIYLVLSFFGSAMLFYLLGAPLLAALEVIVYAGAIMILFVFIIMMLKVEGLEECFFPIDQCLPAMVIGVLYSISGFLLITNEAQQSVTLMPAMAWPKEFAIYLFQKAYLAIEIVSLLLLVALVGAFLIAKSE
jgi:NADH-quinone oxidoreductase subunit J